jgi:hypothetical protein
LKSSSASSGFIDRFGIGASPVTSSSIIAPRSQAG